RPASSARPSRRAAPGSPPTCSRTRARCRRPVTPITSSCSAPCPRSTTTARTPAGSPRNWRGCGGRTRPARKEVGWTVIDSYDPDLIPVGPWLEFHGDTCLPPPEAKILARNKVGVQAFTIGRHLAVQFHPEVDGPQLRRWLDAGAGERAREAGQDPDAFLAETVMQEPAAAARA